MSAGIAWDALSFFPWSKHMLNRLIPLALLLISVTISSADAQVATKDYRWAAMHSGDCEMADGSTLSFRADGSGVFSATTLTYHTHSGDVWHHQITVLSTDGRPLFVLPQWNSPRMDDGNPPPRYGWNAGFTFDPAVFYAIGSARANYSC